MQGLHCAAGVSNVSGITLAIMKCSLGTRAVLYASPSLQSLRIHSSLSVGFDNCTVPLAATASCIQLITCRTIIVKRNVLRGPSKLRVSQNE